jgi:hypothetical protein
LPESSLARTTFIPSRKAESQLPLGGTSEITSPTDRAGRDAVTAMIRGSLASRMTGEKSLTGS